MSEQPTQPAQTQQGADPFRLGWRFVWQKDEKGRWDHVQVPLTREDVLHPQEDDFIVNNELHHKDVTYLYKVLDEAVNGREGMHVFCDHRIDWEVEGLKAHGPDLAVFADVPTDWEPWGNATFYVKKHGARPLLVIEVTSPTTRDDDRGVKVEHYHRAGVPFYAIVDYRSGFEERVVIVLGYQWTPEGYVAVRLDGERRLWLEAVRLWMAGEGECVVCYDEQGQKLLGTKETTRALKQTEARLEEQKGMTEEAIEETAKERKAREEAEKARKEAEGKAADESKARKEAEGKAADESKARKEAEEARRKAEEKVADEAKAREELLARLAEMEAEMRRLRGEAPSA